MRHRSKGQTKSTGRRFVRSRKSIALVAAVLGASSLTLANSFAASGAPQGGLYIALGDSIAAGYGASSPSKSWVQLYLGYLQSNGSGVTDLLDVSHAGDTSTDLRDKRLGKAIEAINTSSDTKAVTIDIGSNDVPCEMANTPACPVAGNLRAILVALNTALATDPGDETVQVMEYYNDSIGTANESDMRQRLLGSDGKVDCSGTAAALGLNDLIRCISLEQGAKPIDILPIFNAGGEAFLGTDHSHPSDAGQLAIAKAFGGAATPTAPPPPPTSPSPSPTSPPALSANKPTLSRAMPGKPFTAWILVTNAGTSKPIKSQVTCQGTLSGRSVSARSHSSSSSGRSSCTWQIPSAAHNMQFRGTITSRFRGSKVSRSFSTKVK
jgi:GDSL-like Lipase/Acylhydrolase family